MSEAIPLRADAEVVSNAAEGSHNWRLRVRVEGWPVWRPGQFVMLSPGARGQVERLDPLLPRPMAIYRSAGSEFEVLYKIVGRGTGLLSDLRPGDPMRVVGPLGLGFELPAKGEHAILVGGGTGIASLFELAAQASQQGKPSVLLGARSAAELMGRDDFLKLDVSLHIATEDGSEGSQGLVTELLSRELAGSEQARVYACGPTPMMRRAAEISAEHGRPCQVSLENTMACGFGVCLGCAVPRAEGDFALVCRDGPVFDSQAVRWEELP